MTASERPSSAATVPPTLTTAAIIGILGDLRQAYQLGIPYCTPPREMGYFVSLHALETRWPGLVELVLEYLDELNHPAFADLADFRQFAREGLETITAVPRGREPLRPVFAAMWRHWKEWAEEPETAAGQEARR